jgi:hypothetical protein
MNDRCFYAGSAKLKTARMGAFAIKGLISLTQFIHIFIR